MQITRNEFNTMYSKHKTPTSLIFDHGNKLKLKG